MSEKVGILLVDDDDAVRGLARIILEHEGWRIEEAGSVAEAKGKVREGGFRPYLAVVDLLLPDGFGTELVEDLRRARHKSKIVYITGDPSWLRKLNAGSESVLAKPFTPIQLIVAVRAALGRLKPVVVFVESGRVYRRLILSALEHADVEIAMASTFEEGLLLARQKEASVLFTPPPGCDEALAGLLDLRQGLPSLEVVALDADRSNSNHTWFDRRLATSYSVQVVAEAARQALNRWEDAEATLSNGSEVHPSGRGQASEQ
jgi:CheY-like chemotaxis protein